MMPKIISMTPARKKVASMMGRASATDSAPDSTIELAITAELTTVIGAVGPLTCVGVPPNSAATMAMAMAPYSPAIGPSAVCAPKARASGRATMPAVSPPKKSPRRLEKSKVKGLVMR